jgi:hypothetical protein
MPFTRERDLLNWIIATAEATGWTVFHVPAPMTAARGGGFVGSKRAAGLPDLFLLHDDPPRMIIAEVKGPNGKLSERQREFLHGANRVADFAESLSGDDRSGEWGERCVGVYAWTPTDEPIIETILRSKTVT